MYRALEWVSAKAITIAGWCYLAITVLICFDIAARRLWGFSTEATIELSGYLMAVGMSWGLAGTLFERGHVRIDVLVQKMPLDVRVWLHLASLLALLAASGFFAWGAVALALDSQDMGATDLSTLRIPMVVPQGLWAAGLALMLLAVVALGARALRQLVAGDADGMDRMLMARTYIDEAAETLEAVAEAQQGMQLPPSAGAPSAAATAASAAAPTTEKADRGTP
ncbi:TRAP transporter small permease subunit [Xylophilus ampelinus]|uniref:TRAP transporter small permease protein n=1 Tax=Xylophilus ampelinus TaxID=54067 RepID=A0A318SCH1_9BURK|nr:TRAP transporter small permease subunit [Xylophilus ampelinus]MCS4511912.1 TRAP transporter small permease [Xylophilus ampelinus]PYE72708.1 TRAP-type C4-dicarboxylate transport system permease small subunit [Xylophilus ampelinus]